MAFIPRPFGNLCCTGNRRGLWREEAGEYTLEDYYKIPEEHRVELIDGVIL